MLTLKCISKEYQTKKEVVQALKNFTYKFENNKFYAIMGSSGSGKSTLISIMGLITKATAGEFLIDGKDVSKLKSDELADLRRDKIGFIFQDYYLDIYLKAYENIILSMLINNKIDSKNRKSKALELLRTVNLENRAEHYPREMSGGEQQRVCLARALANDPDIILADEPTGNLDKENEQLVFQFLKKLSKNKCVIVVSHSEEVKKYADIVLRIDKGELVENEI